MYLDLGAQAMKPEGGYFFLAGTEGSSAVLHHHSTSLAFVTIHQSYCYELDFKL
jgi:hypothetical protein